MARGRSNKSDKDGSEKVKISKESLKQAVVLFKYLKPYKAKFIL